MEQQLRFSYMIDQELELLMGTRDAGRQGYVYQKQPNSKLISRHIWYVGRYQKNKGWYRL
jgi:hypothetical protein